MFKIGILTYHYSVNYGAVLQAYGLYQFLRGRDYEVEFIDYRPQTARNSNLKYLYFRGQRLIDPLLLVSGTKKSVEFNRFWQSRLKMSPKTYYTRAQLQQAKLDYDVVICGSDEIWNIDNSMLEYGADRSFFGDFLPQGETAKVSYAASFGGTIDLKQLQPKIQQLLQDFQTVLVRDSNSQRLVSELGLESKKVLDPTLIADFSQIIEPPKVSKPYILLYGSFSLAQGRCIESLARQKNLDIISIGARPGAWRSPVNRIGISPEQWLGYFQQASFVFTNYFHGTIFAIIFRQPFISFDRPEKSIKVRDLLTDLNLTQHLVKEDQLEEIDFAAFGQLELDTDNLKQKITESQNLLLGAVTQAQSSRLVASSQ